MIVFLQTFAIYPTVNPTVMNLFFLSNDCCIILELIITALGDNVPPVPIEAAIKQELPIVSNVVVIGEQKRFLTCLITFKVSEVHSIRPCSQLAVF